MNIYVTYFLRYSKSRIKTSADNVRCEQPNDDEMMRNEKRMKNIKQLQHQQLYRNIGIITTD